VNLFLPLFAYTFLVCKIKGYLLIYLLTYLHQKYSLIDPGRNLRFVAIF